MGRSDDTIGQAAVVNGQLSATGDLTIEGQVKGKIDLDRNVLTIGPNGRIEAQVHARVVNILGKVEGDISATEAINIRETATVNGAVVAPSVGIEEGASFRGQIDISLTIPLQKVIRRLKPEKPHVRFFRRLVDSSISAMRPEADPYPLFGVSPKLAEATMRILVDGDSRLTGQAGVASRKDESQRLKTPA